MRIAVTAGLSDKKLLSKLEPLLKNDKVERIYLYRKKKIIHDKVENRIQIQPSYSYLFEIVRLFKLLIDSFRFKFDCYIGIYVFLHGIVAFIVGKLFNKPIVQVLPGSDVKYIIEKKRFVSILRGSDVLVTRGETTNKELVNLNIKKEKLIVIPNVYDFEKIRNVQKPEDYRYDLISVSNLVKIKRIDILLESISLLIKKYKQTQIKVGIIGDGSLKNEMIQLCNDLGMKNNVEFLGLQLNVDSFLEKSKIFIMTTEYEGQPQAMIEALAHGIPCIMPGVSNIPEIAINDYNSIIVNPLDVEAFAEAANTLLDDDEKYNDIKVGALNFRQEHEYEYSLDNISNLWNEILSLIKNK